jgi:hypothetical protein
MRKFGNVEVTNRQYELLVKNYIKFYKNHSRCTNECPMNLHLHPRQRPKYIQELFDPHYDTLFKSTLQEKCFCNVLPMFTSRGCPCMSDSENAFTQLEEFIEVYGKEFM